MSHASSAEPNVVGERGGLEGPAAGVLLATPQNRRDNICVHIFTTSATLVGVCLTVIGLLRVVQRLRDVGTLADELLSLDAIAFLAACCIAYVALRTDDTFRRRRIERIADVAFLSGLALMTGVCALLAVEFL